MAMPCGLLGVEWLSLVGNRTHLTQPRGLDLSSLLSVHLLSIVRNDNAVASLPSTVCVCLELFIQEWRVQSGSGVVEMH